MQILKKYYARIWTPIFLFAAYFFYPDGEHVHHMMGNAVLGLPEMTWMWLFMAAAHVHLFWGCSCTNCSANCSDNNPKSDH